MLRYMLFVLIRSLLIFAVLYAVYKLVTSTLRSFFEGLRGSGDVRQRPGPPSKKEPYRDVQDAEFKDLDRT